jgi:cytochrome c553
MDATRVFAALATTLMIGGAASAAEAPAGVSSCTGCHTASARVDTPVPRIAGKPAADIASQMVAFKAGQRAGTIMDRIAKGFSDDEIKAIAAWYAEQK